MEYCSCQLVVTAFSKSTYCFKRGFLYYLGLLKEKVKFQLEEKKNFKKTIQKKLKGKKSDRFKLAYFFKLH